MGGGAKILLWDIIQNSKGVKNLIGVKKIRRSIYLGWGHKYLNIQEFFLFKNNLHLNKKIL